MVFIANPTEVLLSWMKATGVRPDFRYGQLAMALEIITAIQVLEQVPTVEPLQRETAISAMLTLLTDQGMRDSAYEAYEMLGEWRAVKFRPVALPHERALSDGGVADAQRLADLLEFGDDPVSLVASRRVEPAQTEKHDQLPVGRQSQGEGPTYEQGARSDEGGRRTPSE